MPMYGFRCPACGSEFEVSRPMRDAGNPTTCPMDGAVSSRVFTATATIGGTKQEAAAPAAPKPQAPSGYNHFGHSHGMGAASHGHGGGFKPQPPARLGS